MTKKTVVPVSWFVRDPGGATIYIKPDRDNQPDHTQVDRDRARSEPCRRE